MSVSTDAGGAVEQQLTTLLARVEELEAETEALHARVDEQDERIAEKDERIEALEAELDSRAAVRWESSSKTKDLTIENDGAVFPLGLLINNTVSKVDFKLAFDDEIDDFEFNDALDERFEEFEATVSVAEEDTRAPIQRLLDAPKEVREDRCPRVSMKRAFVAWENFEEWATYNHAYETYHLELDKYFDALVNEAQPEGLGAIGDHNQRKPIAERLVNNSDGAIYWDTLPDGALIIAADRDALLAAKGQRNSSSLGGR